MQIEKHFHFIIPVWGEEYTKLFTDICLPMLMIPGNLGNTPLNENDKYIIVTTWEDSKKIKASLAYEQLQKLMPVKFILIDGLTDLGNVHRAMSYCYAAAMQENDVIPEKTYYVFLTPDSFWSEGTFMRLRELKEHNFKIAMAMGLRVKAEPMTGDILNLLYKNNGKPLSLPTNELIQLVFKHMHPMTRAFDLFSKEGFLNEWPSNLYWIDHNENQLIAHCFHMHPLMVQAPKGKVSIGTTIDGEFIKNLKYPLDSFYIFQDNHFGIDLTSSERNWGIPLKQPSLNKILEFSMRYTNNYHKHFFKHQIKIANQPIIDPALATLISRIVSIILKFNNNIVYTSVSKSYYLLDKLLHRMIPKVFKNILQRTKRKILGVVLSNINHTN